MAERRRIQQQQQQHQQQQSLTPAVADAETRAKLQSLVGRLAESLGLAADDTVVAVSSTMLTKMVSPYAMTQASVQHTQRSLSSRAPDAASYAAAYRRASEKNIPGLDRFLMVLARIAAEPEVMSMLCETGPSRTTSIEQKSKRYEEQDTDRSPRGSENAYVRKHSVADAAEPAAFAELQVSRTSSSALSNRSINSDVSPVHSKKHVVTQNEMMRSSSHTHIQRYPDSDAENDNNRQPRQRTSIAKPEASKQDRWEKITTDLLHVDTTNDEIEYDPGQDKQLRASAKGEMQLPEAIHNKSENLRPTATPEHARDLLHRSRDDELSNSIPSSTLPTPVVATTSIPDDRELSTIQSQEAHLTQEILTCLLGMSTSNETNGSHSISVLLDSMTLKLYHEVDPLLRNQAERLLEVGESILKLNSFVVEKAEYSAGMIGQAMSATIRQVIADWRTMVIQMEHHCRCQPSGLSLASLWYYVQPSSSAFRLLASVFDTAREKGYRGATLLNMLEDLSMNLAGDSASRSLVQSILQASATPLISALDKWLHYGDIDDPYEDFMIEENPHLKKESLASDYDSMYWHQRYTLRESAIPKQLGPHASTILLTGKTLNALRECNVPFLMEERTPVHDLWTGKGIQVTYERASRRFHSHLMKEANLIEALESVKKFLLVGQGDFLVHFMDSADAELRKPVRAVRCGKLQSLLELALRTSSAAADRYHEDYYCSIEKESIVAQLLEIFDAKGPNAAELKEKSKSDANVDVSNLSGYDALTLGFNVGWPVSLVLSRRALAKYQVLFRHLFHCKHVEQSVAKAWHRVRLVRVRSRFQSSVSNILQGCQLMLHFLQNLLQYMTFEVIEPNFLAMKRNLVDTTDVEEILRLHDAFLDTSLKECMLFWPVVLQRLNRLKAVCLAFSQLTMQLDVDIIDVDPYTEGETSHVVDHIQSKADDSSFNQAVEQYVVQFRQQARTIVSMLEKSALAERNLAHLITRLNFNGFYSEISASVPLYY